MSFDVGGFDSPREALVDYISYKLRGQLESEEIAIDDYLNDPERYEDSFIDPDRDEIRERLAELIDCIPSDISEETIDRAIAESEIGLGPSYHLADNAIAWISLYGSEYNYQVDLDDWFTDLFAQLTLDELETIARESDTNIDSLQSGSVFRYTLYDCTPCLVVSDEFLDDISDIRPVYGPTQLSASERRQMFQIITGGKKPDSIDQLRANMKRWDRRQKRINSDRLRENQKLI